MLETFTAHFEWNYCYNMEQGFSFLNGKKCHSISAYDSVKTSTAFTKRWIAALLKCTQMTLLQYKPPRCQFSISNFRLPSLFSKLTWILCTKLLGHEKTLGIKHTRKCVTYFSALCCNTVYSPTNSTYNYKEFGSSC